MSEEGATLPSGRIARIWGATVGPIWSGVAGHLGEVARGERYHRLRMILLAGLLARLVLAPLTSWSIDTNTFVESGIATVYTGNPYAGGLWYNPPLGPYLSIPSMAAAVLVAGPNHLFHPVPGMIALSIREGYPTVLPTPLALLAWKLPLLLADVVMAIALDWALRFRVPGLAPEVGASLWYLNPLVIWAVAVHGEVDGVAACLVVLALLSIACGRWFPAGLSIALAFFTKGYPLVLVPLVLVWVAFSALGGPARARPIARRLGWLAAGAAVGTVPFLAFLMTTFGQLTARANVGLYGALSVTVIFNPGVPKGIGPYHAFTTNLANAAAMVDVFLGMAVLGVVAGSAILARRLLRRRPSDPPELSTAALVGAWALAGVLIADPIPNAENVLALLPFLVLAVPKLPFEWTGRLTTGVSIAGVFQYFSLVTPAVFFYPAAAAIGPGAVGAITNAAIDYLDVPGLRGFLWLLVGLIGGTFLLASWFASGWFLMPASLRHRLRHPRGGGPRDATDD